MVTLTGTLTISIGNTRMIWSVLKVAHTYFMAVESTRYIAKNIQKELLAISAVNELIEFIVAAAFYDGASFGIIYVSEVKFKSRNGAVLLRG